MGAKKTIKKSIPAKRPKGRVAKPPLFKKTTLFNGVRVLTEKHPTAQGVSVGFWIETGTRDEADRVAGVSHFVEHQVFKGTRNRTAFEIARDLEIVGGEINAFTGREYTCFFTHSLKKDLRLSIDVLSDLTCRAKFSEDDFDKEKQVILQELSMSEDSLEDIIFDYYFERVFAGAPAGRPILGTEKSLEQMTLDDVLSYYQRTYVGPRIIVSVAGDVEHDEVVELVQKRLRPFKLLAPDSKIVQPRATASLSGFSFAEKKPSEQVHILMGLPASSFKSPQRFEAYVINSLLGGGMTSRLYQKIREDHGLVYTIYSQLSTMIDVGMSLVYAGTEEKNANQVIDLIRDEFVSLRDRKVKKADVDLFRTQVEGQILLGSDDIENRMNSLAINEMVFGEYRSVESVIREVNAVSVNSLNAYIESYIDMSKLGAVVLGDCSDSNLAHARAALSGGR